MYAALSAFSRWVHGRSCPDRLGGRHSGHLLKMRAEVVVRGMLDQVDLWPYAIDSECRGTTTVVTLEIHDRQEFLGVLERLVTRGIEVSQAQMLN